MGGVHRICRCPRAIPQFLARDFIPSCWVQGSRRPATPSGSGGNTFTLSEKEANDLKSLHGGLQTIMRELDALLRKYHTLTENLSISFDRLTWGQEDLSELGERIVVHVGLLTAFNTSLMSYVNPSL